MLAHVIKFENCFTLSIRIKDFYSFKDKLTLLKCLEINEIFNVKKQYHFKAPFGEHFISHLTDKNVRFDINENQAKNVYHVKPIFEASNVT